MFLCKLLWRSCWLLPVFLIWGLEMLLGQDPAVKGKLGSGLLHCPNDLVLLVRFQGGENSSRKLFVPLYAGVCGFNSVSVALRMAFPRGRKTNSRKRIKAGWAVPALTLQDPGSLCFQRPCTAQSCSSAGHPAVAQGARTPRIIP